MKKRRFLLLATVTMALSACDKENNNKETEVAAHFTSNLAPRVESRAADDAWHAEDAIGVFSINDELAGVSVDGANLSNMAVNLKYTRGGDGTWDGGATAFRFKNPVSTPVTFKAYYPHREDITGGTAGEIDGTITVDASEQTDEGQKAFDVLYADKADETGTLAPTGSKENPRVNFQFKHAMSKVVIVLQGSEEHGVTFEKIKTMIPTLKGLKAAGTFSLADGQVTASGDPVDLKLSNGTEGAKTKAWIAIVPPQTALSGAELSIREPAEEGDETTYRGTKILSGQPLEAGKSYTYTITVKKMDLIVNSSNITDWEEGTGGTGDAVMQ